MTSVGRKTKFHRIWLSWNPVLRPVERWENKLGCALDQLVNQQKDLPMIDSNNCDKERQDYLNQCPNPPPSGHFPDLNPLSTLPRSGSEHAVVLPLFRICTRHKHCRMPRFGSAPAVNAAKIRIWTRHQCCQDPDIAWLLNIVSKKKWSIPHRET